MKYVLVILLVFVVACSQNNGTYKMNLTSPEFKDNEQIPSKFTCDGYDISPTLNIGELPENTKTLALITDDPDAPTGTFTHWIVWNINPTNTIKEGEKPGIEGKNDFGSNGYKGPCPPSGTHRYFFRLYALDTVLDLKEEATKSDLKKAMKTHVLAKAELIGTYKR